MFENYYYNDSLMHREKNISHQKKLTNHNEVDNKRLKDILDLLHQLLEKDVLINSEDFIIPSIFLAF